jgi:lipopolysaccharide/colanic/teichoic acid biosynthesis glycosyltransferase
VFFRGVRVGRHGKSFRIIKFRTMVVNADKLGGPSTAADDPRITRMGRFIRRFNLDELPQIFNVLAGDMSLVGPRPEVPQYVALFTEEEKKILTVRPGITDWATLWIGNEGKWLEGAEDPEKVYMEKLWPEKHRLQLEYVRRQSLWVDCQIMLKTLKVHLFDRFKADAAMPSGGR